MGLWSLKMAKDPTFSESWYRVAELSPRLRSIVEIKRQNFRGKLWYVLHDSTNNTFFRLSTSSYYFIARLDGQRTVGDVWKKCVDELGDDALTQGEAIRLMGQLYVNNLLQTDVSPDTENLFKRSSQRKNREVVSSFTNIMFLRFPLYDPDPFLEKWCWLFGRIFSWYGLVLLILSLSSGLYYIKKKIDEIGNLASGVLSPDNLPLLYLSFAALKIIHEFAHAFACKKYGRDEGTKGEVHTMGILLLIFMPLPYIDVTSAWALRKKWHRIIIGAAGILTELFIAGIAAAIWASTSQGTTMHAIAYNVMFVASVSTLIFNGNPLLRYDAYYILSDFLEIPNLSMQSKEYMIYILKRYFWGIKELEPASSYSTKEKYMLLIYYIAALICRTIISISIFLFVASKFFFFGVIAAIVSLGSLILMPLSNFFTYLSSSPELRICRKRAIATTIFTAVLLLLLFTLIPFPDTSQVEGIVEPEQIVIIYAKTDGKIKSFQPSGTHITPKTKFPIVSSSNIELQCRKEKLEADIKIYQIKARIARQNKENAFVKIYTEQMETFVKQLNYVNQEINNLNIYPSIQGVWIAPDIPITQDSFISKGKRIGVVANLENLIIRAVIPQDVAARLISEKREKVEIRVKGRPDLSFEGKIDRILPSGHRNLPSQALGYNAGGSTELDSSGSSGAPNKSVDRFFEVRLSPENKRIKLFSGQRVLIKFRMPSKPLIIQIWRSLGNLLQKRFHI